MGLGIGAAGEAAGEVVDPELSVGLVLGDDVPGDYQHGVRDGEDRLGLASAAETSPEALVLRAQVGAAGAGRGPGGLHHRGAQRGVALAGAPGGSFAGRLVVARAQPGPGRQVRRAGEAGHVGTGSARSTHAVRGPTPGMVPSSSTARVKGATSASTWASS